MGRNIEACKHQGTTNSGVAKRFIKRSTKRFNRRIAKRLLQRCRRTDFESFMPDKMRYGYVT